MIMQPEILLVRQGDGYRILHGHLHLVNSLSQTGEALADASGEGKVKLFKTPSGIMIGNDNKNLPLLLNE
jgi:hypothetical protein